jgi:hypothetical protein
MRICGSWCASTIDMAKNRLKALPAALFDLTSLVRLLLKANR